MPGVFVGSTELTAVGDIKVGSTDVQEIYVGATKVFPSGVGPDPSIVYFYDPLNDGALPGSSAFTRASIALEYDGTDYTQISSGTVREDSLAATGGAKGFLSEPEATNIIIESNDFADAAWGKQRLGLTGNGTNSLGLQEFTLDDETETGSHRMFEDLGTQSGDHTVSIIAKDVTRQYINATTTGSAAAHGTYDLDNGTITETGSTDSPVTRITDLGSGFYKGEVSTDTVTPVGFFTIISLSDTATPGNANVSYDGTNDTLLLCLVQQETTSFSTTPILTSGTTETRLADVLDTGIVIASAFSALLDLTLPNVVGGGNTISLLGPDATATDILFVDENFNVRMNDGGTLTTIGTSSASARIKVAYGRDATGRSASLDGATAVTGDAPSAAHEGDTFQLGATNSVNQSRCIHHTSTLYNVRKSDAELEALSS